MTRPTFRNVTITLMIGIVASLAVTIPADARQIRWYDYDEGTSLGKKQGKKVLLFFWADWCASCEKMKKETFRVPDVIAFLNKNFIPVKVDSENEKRLASRYFVRGLPTTWFLNERGERIGSRPGFMAPDLFLSILKYMHTNSYREMSFSEFAEK